MTYSSTDERRSSAKTGAVLIRVRTSDEIELIRQIADRDFEGNLSMAIRRAIREFVERDQAPVVEAVA